MFSMCKNTKVDSTHDVVLSPWQDARWRRGESVSLKTARDSMVSLELASQAQMVTIANRTRRLSANHAVHDS